MSHPALRGLAFVIGLVSLAMSTAAVVMYARTPELDPLAGWGFAGYDALFSLVYVAVGLLIVMRRPRNVIGWLFLISAIFSGTQTLTGAYGVFARGTDPEGAAISYWITEWVWIPAVGLIILTLLLYPNERLPTPRWRWAAWGLIPATLIPTAFWAVVPPPQVSPGAATFDPFLVPADHVLRGLSAPSVLLVTLWFLIAAASLVQRIRSGTALERQQVKWIAYASAILGAALTLSIVTAFTIPEHPFTKATQILAIATVLVIPVSATVAILRYRLYDIDVLINRTLVYVAVSAVLVGSYALGVVLFQSLLRPFTAGSEFAIAVSTLVVAALFQPVRARVQNVVDRRFYRSRYDAALTLDAFSARLREDVDLDSVRADLVGVLDRTVRPAHASVWLRDQ